MSASDYSVPSARANQSKGRPVVLAGPSAVGKSSVVAALREKLPDLYFSVSMTTRDPRPGESDGVDYYFVSKPEFIAAVDAGRMLEWAEIHGGIQNSGTPAQPVEDAINAGRPVLIEVDLAGARQLRVSMPEAIQVFLEPPSWSVLEQRLRGRGTESNDVIERRLATARTELDARKEFDHIIVNDQLDHAVQELIDLLVSP